MTARTWTHRLEEWSQPRPASAMATVALALVAMALVLLALGGVALAQDPVAFDLWVLAIGLFLLAGALVGIGRSPDRNPHPDRARAFSDHASLAEAPAISSVGDAEPEAPVRRAPAAPRAWAASDTIAGQYAEASRLRASRAAARRLAASGGEEPDEAGYPYTFTSSRRGPWDPSAAPRRTAIELELEQLRARVADLEASRTGLAGPPAFSEPGWPGPSLCVGCRTVLVGGPDDARCPRCGRPLCAKCYAAVPDGATAHQCPECRGTPPAAPVEGRGGASVDPRPRAPIPTAARPSWLESP